MSPIAIGLDGLLILLLLLTLMVGLRLNARLKGLRADHAGFAKAVGELDAALLRAEGGLKELKAATAEAQGMLASRVQEARSAAARLDELIAKAAMAPTPQPSHHPRASGDPGFLSLDRMVQPASEPAANNIEPFKPSARSRARVDEDLFASASAAEAEPFPRLRFGGAAR